MYYLGLTSKAFSSQLRSVGSPYPTCCGRAEKHKTRWEDSEPVTLQTARVTPLFSVLSLSPTGLVEQPRFSSYRLPRSCAWVSPYESARSTSVSPIVLSVRG
jgi:hypothetical protein